MKKYLLGILVLITLNSGAQVLEWAKMYGGINCDSIEIKSTVIDQNGFIYICGFFRNSADFDPGPDTLILTSSGNGWGDIFICKLSPDGQPIWAQKFVNTNTDFINSFRIDVDPQGNLYATGNYSGTVDFDPGTGISLITSQGTYEDIFFLKLNTNGIFQWVKSIKTNMDTPPNIKTNANGNIFIVGAFTGSVDFDSGTGTTLLTSATSSIGMFICKYDTNGNIIFGKSLDKITPDANFSFDIDLNDNIVIYNMYTGTLDLDPGSGVFNLTTPGLSAFILKLNSLGDFVWAKELDVTNFYVNINSLSIDNSDNIIYTGAFSIPTDFDLGAGNFTITPLGNTDMFISKIDGNGNFLWAKQIGGISSGVIALNLTIDFNNSIYFEGFNNNVVDFDPGPLQVMSPTYSTFIEKIDSNGIFGFCIPVLSYFYYTSLNIYQNEIIRSGNFNDITNFDVWGMNGILDPNFTSQVFIARYRPIGIIGNVFYDYNNNCIKDMGENGISNKIIQILPGNIIAQSNSNGNWYIDSLPVGTYTAIVDTTGGSYTTGCLTSQVFNVNSAQEITYVTDFGLTYSFACPSPHITIVMPNIRPCFPNQHIYVQAQNDFSATDILYNAYADVELDPLFTVTYSTIPYAIISPNIFRFQLGDIYPGQTVSFRIDVTVDCSILAGQTICMQAELFPQDPCIFDTIPSPYHPNSFTPCTSPWDHSSLTVDSYCQNDSVFFVITNTGNNGTGDMNCFSPVRIYLNGYWIILDSVLLTGGDTAMFAFPGNGETWRLEVDQHPLHPGNSHPNETIEACGDTANWNPGLVNILPSDDADPSIDIYCGVVTTSYDPNDKTGYPLGVSATNNIMPNQELQYVIRFQNTGTDTAFTVIIRDTLETNLDIFSVISGTASHNYDFRIYGTRVLEWTFNNILLPDSNHNEPQSHGFVSFTVNQLSYLTNYTEIHNDADIYFDYNLPVTTNQTIHTIYDGIQTIMDAPQHMAAAKSSLLVYPNPSSVGCIIQIPEQNTTDGVTYYIHSMDGKIVRIGTISTNGFIDYKNIESGIYNLSVCINESILHQKIIVIK